MDQLVELFYAKFSADVARFQAPHRSSMRIPAVYAGLCVLARDKESAVGTSAPLREILEAPASVQ